MYKHLDKRIKKQYAYILIILQKPCQTIKCLIISEILILGGARFCANPHVLRAIPHSQHNANVKI
jgi:hypothetical protein